MTISEIVHPCTTNIFEGLRPLLVEDEGQRIETFRLRYRAYLAEGAIEPKPRRIFYDRYDLQHTSLLIAVAEEGKGIVGSVRFGIQPGANLAPVDFMASPEAAVFPDALERLAGDNRLIVSGARLCIQPDHHRRRQIAMLLMMALASAGVAVRAKWAIATARGGHLHFYRRLLRMDQIAEPKLMPGLLYEYALLATDIDRVGSEVTGEFPTTCRDYFHAMVPDWNRRVRTASRYVTSLEAA